MASMIASKRRRARGAGRKATKAKTLALPPARGGIGLLSDAEADDLHKTLVHRSFLAWWENHGRIATKQDLAPVLKQANVLQQRIGEAVAYCLAEGLPIRIVCLKPRQRGISTITTALMWWMLHRWPLKGLIVGGKEEQWKNLWEMVRRYAENDDFDWGFGHEIGAEAGTVENGSILSTETAGAKDPGRSGTYHCMICTEIGRWAEKGVANAKGVLSGLLKCVPYQPHTMVVLESTSRGSGGAFWEKWNEAVSLEDFKAGRRGPEGFVRVFAGWHEFGERDALADSETAAGVLAGIGARNEQSRLKERALMARLRLDAEQIKYYRRILAECGNDWEELGREYPTDPDEAFAAASACRFNTEGIKLLKAEAALAFAEARFGMLSQSHPQRDDVLVWTPSPGNDPDGGNFVVHEHPMPECRYVVSVDNASGMAVEGDEKKLDCHAASVKRAGFFRKLDNGRMQWVRPAVVAAIKPDQRVDIDILADWVWRLHCYYGKCLIVPEANNDRGLIMLLRKRGALLFERERPATDKESSKPSGKFGFWTRGGDGENARNAIIENLAKMIREVATVGDGIFIPFPWMVDELAHFRIDPDDGKAKGMDGWHDDWVMELAMGMACLSGATAYVRPLVEVAGPRDQRHVGVRPMRGSGENQV